MKTGWTKKRRKDRIEDVVALGQSVPYGQCGVAWAALMLKMNEMTDPSDAHTPKFDDLLKVIHEIAHTYKE